MAVTRLESYEYKKYKYDTVDEMMSHITQLQSQKFVLLYASALTLSAQFKRAIP